MNRRTVGLTLAALVMTACGGKPGGVAPETVAVYPPSPDTARIQYLTRITTEDDIGRKGPSLVDRIVGRRDNEIKVIGKPYGMAIRDGRLFVCDQTFRGLDVVDLNGGSFEFFVPDDPYGIRLAVNCFVDDRGLLYVTDAQRKQVQVYDSTLSGVATFGGEDDGAPVDVFVEGDRIYVSQLGSGRGIRVYDRDTRTALFRFPDVEASDSAGLVAPANLFVFNGEVYVSDMLKQQVFVYSTDGEFRRHIGRPGTGPSTFQRPKGIAVDSAGFVYVVDAAFQNVQVFSPEGRLLMFFGGGGDAVGAMALPAKVVIDYDPRHLDYFRKWVLPGLDLKFLLFVTNQFGPVRVGVYGFVGPTDYLIPLDTAAEEGG